MSNPKNNEGMLYLKRVRFYMDSKQREAVTLSFDQETAIALVEKLTANLENPRGVKIDVHYTKVQSKDGREFDSGFAFADGIQEPRAYDQPTTFTRTQQTAPIQAAQKASGSTLSIKEKLAKAKASVK